MPSEMQVTVIALQSSQGVLIWLRLFTCKVARLKNRISFSPHKQGNVDLQTHRLGRTLLLQDYLLAWKTLAQE